MYSIIKAIILKAKWFRYYTMAPRDLIIPSSVDSYIFIIYYIYRLPYFSQYIVIIIKCRGTN